MPLKATPPRPRRPTRISSRFGKTPTLTFRFSSLPRRSMRSCNSYLARFYRTLTGTALIRSWPEWISAVHIVQHPDTTRHFRHIQHQLVLAEREFD